MADPLDGQSYNRYSYVLNNPLRYTDPSGFGPQAPVLPPTQTTLGNLAVTLKEWADGKKAPMGPPPPPPQDKQPAGGSSDGTGLTPPTPPGAGPPPPPDNPGDDTGGAGEGGLDEGMDPDDETPKEPEPSWKDDPWVQGVGGFFVGLGLGATPGGAVVETVARGTGPLAKGTREANIGKSLGEIVGGAGISFLGVGGTAGGGTLSATGIGAIVGVPAIAVSTGLVAGGTVNVGVGMANLHSALRHGSGPPSASPPPPQMHKHHLLPQKFRDQFTEQRIDIDKYCVELPADVHLKGIHGKGMGSMPGDWNGRWQQFFKANPDAKPNQIFDFMHLMIKDYGLQGLPIVPYR